MAPLNTTELDKELADLRQQIVELRSALIRILVDEIWHLPQPTQKALRRVQMGDAMLKTNVQAASNSSSAADIRVWARENDIPVSERGRISANIIAKFLAVHQQTSPSGIESARPV